MKCGSLKHTKDDKIDILKYSLDEVCDAAEELCVKLEGYYLKFEELINKVRDVIRTANDDTSYD